MDIAANLNNVRQRIAAACARAGRLAESVTLVTVSKGHPAEVVRAAADLGLSVFGENRVQEARVKIGLCPGRLRWHLIGHLQSNKCRDAVHFFEMIQSVDSLALAREINKWAEKSAKTMPADRGQYRGRVKQIWLRPGTRPGRIEGSQRAAESGIARADDGGALHTGRGKGAAGFSAAAGTEGPVRGSFGRAAAAFEHGHER
jgi:hypothetical protein